MTTETPACAVVMHVDDVAAICTIDRIEPAPWLLNLPVQHPDRVLVETKCLVARSYLLGDVDGPYDDHECEAAARILIDEELPAAPPLRRPKRRRRRG
ncbi:unannotated protein [freshwater metagenome]|uniref:Unannotated protein n=1 Tax=freshwater metagenome TaxID=449393 RepID=A0A6J7FAI3_9ZZZZ|nr:hypothetical protein [Actinomycetota bacterium]